MWHENNEAHLCILRRKYVIIQNENTRLWTVHAYTVWLFLFTKCYKVHITHRYTDSPKFSPSEDCIGLSKKRGEMVSFFFLFEIIIHLIEFCAQ